LPDHGHVAAGQDGEEAGWHTAIKAQGRPLDNRNSGDDIAHSDKMEMPLKFNGAVGSVLSE
jgi:hypothetical protein